MGHEQIDQKRSILNLSFSSQIYTFRQSKIAMTTLYDKMQMNDTRNCVPSGYNPPNEQPISIPHAEHDPRRCYRTTGAARGPNSRNDEDEKILRCKFDDT